ncbi:MAG: BtrH N-terminal domain-containing protein [Bacteroidota bacterium]|nr:BtrH N-terminal domain-containing protein [Bacteroidota bacterium]
MNFVHKQSAHCENGVVSNLLTHNGLNISEPMVFGLGSGLFFVYLPFLKVNHAPAISYRPMPGAIFNNASKILGVKVRRQKFSNTQTAQMALDENLKNNIPTGLQVGVYGLKYFPDQYRFHFNAHNLVVYGKNNSEYLISDPVMENVTTLTDKELEEVRFAKGTLAPKGHLYYPTHIPKQIDWSKAIKKAILKNCNQMLAPVPLVGVKAMRKLARDIKKWPAKIGVAKTNYYLAQLIRMQEEIGTGGGGFRFIYAAFLQEAAQRLNSNKLLEYSNKMTYIGDLWRELALQIARVYKKRSHQTDVYESIADTLLKISYEEETFFKNLKKTIKNNQFD